MALNIKKRYTCNPVVSCGDEGRDGSVLFNPDTDDVMIINPTGRTIWESLSTPRTLDEIAAYLEEHFHIDSTADETIKEVEEFLQTLLPDFVRESE